MALIRRARARVFPLRRWVPFGAIVLLISFIAIAMVCIAQESDMDDRNREKSILLPLEALAVDEPAEVDGLQWVLWRNSPRLAVSCRSPKLEPVLRVFSIDDAGSAGPLCSFTLSAQLSRPQWSLSGDSEESFHMALTHPGSAICPISLWSPDSEEAAVSGLKPNGVFQHPRFVRRSARAVPPVTAVDPAAGQGAVVAFIPPDSEDHWAFHQLFQPEEGVLQQALAVQHDDGFLLFYKIFVPGSVKMDSGGAIPSLPHAHSGSVMPGILHCIRIDKSFQISGKPFRPLGDELLFEFDADLFEHRVALLGTTASGFMASESMMDGDALIETSRIHRHLSPPLSAPSVMIAENRLFLAVLESTGSPDARVLFATAGY
jgi:hypothetical protein